MSRTCAHERAHIRMHARSDVGPERRRETEKEEKSGEGRMGARGATFVVATAEKRLSFGVPSTIGIFLFIYAGFT